MAVNPGYASWQLAKALVSANRSDDSATQDRARARAKKWQQVFENIVDGTVDYGSRTPLPDVPVWATSEVVTGGFVTGNLLAGGPLQMHEEELLQAAGVEVSSDAPRKSLNLWHLTDEGIASLVDALRSGRYDVQVPEEGALLVVALLIERGDGESARELLDSIGGYFDKLRFYPARSDSASPSGTDVFLWDVQRVAASIADRKPNDQIDAQREAVEVWAPLLDKLIELILQAVDGDAPFQNIAPDWNDRATKLLKEISDAEATHRLCKKPHKPKANFAQLRALLNRQLDAGLSDREAKRARELLDRSVAKRGEPGSDRHAAIRTAQRQQVAAPSYYDLSRVVLKRLSELSQDDGVDDTLPIVNPVTPVESSKSVPTRSEIPDPVVRKVRRCKRDSVENLVDAGVIRSAETLAEVLPQITAGIRALGIRDADLRRLYASVYRAFRRRRSLLLFNLEHQVEIEELPWVASMEKFRDDDLGAKEASRQALADVSMLTITSFPQAIVPNKMLQELRALAKGAELDLPIVDELAADIFMGTFTGKFVRAAKVAAELLDGSLYANYYGIDCSTVLGLSEPSEKRGLFRRVRKDEFAEFVTERAGVRAGGWDVAVNGMLIEQQQILTTQNLAVLTAGLDLRSKLASRADDLARTCYRWICRRLQANATNYHDHLIALKNSAYAWRQMVFFLSLLSDDDQSSFIRWAGEQLGDQPAAFRARFAPAVVGLRAASEDGIAPPKGPGDAGAKFLGWTKERHWLMPPQK
jgi:hypothetical protein